MSVLPGEGTHVLLYGMVPVPTRARTLQGYLARPDLAGSYPATVLVPPAGGITSAVKDLARRLARHGLVVLAPDLHRGAGPGRRATAAEVAASHARIGDGRARADLGEMVSFLRSPGTEWADPGRIGICGVGEGGRWAVQAAIAEPSVRSVALCYAPLGEVEGRPGRLADLVGDLDVPLLGIYGKGDAAAGVDLVPEARRRHGRSSWVLYDGVGHGFLDDGSDTYDPAAAKDALERLVRFFAEEPAVTRPAA